MRHTAIDTAYARNELQTMFAMTGIVRPVSKQHVSKQPVSKQSVGLWSGREGAGWLKPLLPFVKPLALWWQHKRQPDGKWACSASAPELTVKAFSRNPQRAASPLVPHRPTGRTGRRVPTVQTQQTLFAVLDQMGARHRAAISDDPLTRAFEQMLESRGKR